jgi:hypothetical protein
MKIPYINTNDGVTIVLRGRPHTISSEDPNYERVISMIDTDAEEFEYEQLLTETSRKLREVLSVALSMEYSDGVIKHNGEVLANYAADRLVQQIQAGRDWHPLANFLEKVLQNTSKRAVDNLYQFLEAGNIPLTPDGDFLVYKAVRADFRDIYSGKFSNVVGSVVTMPRNAVDEDPDRTCSSGLHVCSFAYLPYFSHANGHVMMCKVSPADVVAIPADYNNTKMRVSRYEVVAEVEGYYADHVDVLGKAGEELGVLAPAYTVVIDGDGPVGKYFSFDEAKRQARHAYESEQDDAVTVTVEDEDGFVVYSIDEDGEY